MNRILGPKTMILRVRCNHELLIERIEEILPGSFCICASHCSAPLSEAKSRFTGNKVPGGFQPFEAVRYIGVARPRPPNFAAGGARKRACPDKRKVEEAQAVLPRHGREGMCDRFGEFVGLELFSPDLLNEDCTFLPAEFEPERRAGRTCKKFMAPHHASLDVLRAMLEAIYDNRVLDSSDHEELAGLNKAEVPRPEVWTRPVGQAGAERIVDTVARTPIALPNMGSLDRFSPTAPSLSFALVPGSATTTDELHAGGPQLTAGRKWLEGSAGLAALRPVSHRAPVTSKVASAKPKHGSSDCRRNPCPAKRVLKRSRTSACTFSDPQYATCQTQIQTL